MANSDAGGVRHVRCPKCHSLLQEPSGVPVYQCGGCGATLRAKIRSGDTQGASSSASPSSRSAPPPHTRHFRSGDVASTSRSSTPTPPYNARSSSEQQATGDLVSARKHGSGDVASTSSGTPDATGTRRSQETSMATTSDLLSVRKGRSSSDVASTSSSTPDVTATSRRQQATDTRRRRESSSGDLVPASKSVSQERVPATQKKGHDQSTTNRDDSFEFRRQRRESDDAVSPGVSVNLGREARDQARTSELQADSEKRKGQAEEAVQPQLRGRQEPAPKSAQEDAELQPSRDSPPPPAAAAAAIGKVPKSPPRRHELQAEEDLAPLRQKILKTVDALKGDLSELFSKSPDLNPTTRRARPPRHPKQEEAGHASRGAAASTLPASTRARHAANRHGVSSSRAAAWRGLPSRRYRRCRADLPSCDDNVHTTCHHHHGCCCHHHHHHGKPECSSCRGHCGRPTRATPHEQEPSSAPRKQPPANNMEARKRRPPPRHHCRPVLKGAPFIICSACFQLVQVPADFAVSTNRLRKLRCGACATVLSYSYRDPARKKDSTPMDPFGTDAAHPDPFAPFTDGFGLSSYSTTEDEESQPLHVSRNTSFDTVDGVKRQGRLHRLMGYGSASELLRHSPDLYESLDDRTTPDYDRKGKGVCIDDAQDDLDDSDDDDENSGLSKRGSVWPMPGAPGPGAIRIKS